MLKSIPNTEIKNIYEDTILDWFEDQVQLKNRDEFLRQC